jgi:hypothetical protein
MVMRRASCLAAALLAVPACAGTTEPEDGVRVSVSNVVVSADGRSLSYDFRVSNMGRRTVYVPGCLLFLRDRPVSFQVGMLITVAESVRDWVSFGCAGAGFGTTTLPPDASVDGRATFMPRVAGARYTPAIDVTRDARIDSPPRRVLGAPFTAP